MTRREKLVEVLLLVAANADDQIASFPEFVVVPDEVALALDDILSMYADGELEGDVGVIAAQGIRKLDEQFTALGGPGDFWSEPAMRSDPAWQSTRDQARSILATQAVALRSPRISWNTYVSVDDVPPSASQSSSAPMRGETSGQWLWRKWQAVRLTLARWL